jgi:phage baseplate assembly protein W
MMTSAQQDQLNRSLFGRDLATVETLPGQDLGRDLVISTSGACDLATVAGVDNLSQSLTLALTTRLGDDIFDTSYGFDGLNALADEIDPILQRERIRVGIVSVLQRDSRVRQITDVTLDGDVFARSRTLAVTVSFRTIASTQVSVSLNPVVSNG